MLVKPDRVHRAVYADPAIFDLEMERIFGRAWLILGHDSQVPKVGTTSLPGWAGSLSLWFAGRRRQRAHQPLRASRVDGVR